MADNSRRAWLQFSLRTLAWIMLCAGIGLGTYRQGLQDGRNHKEPPPKSPFGHAHVYYVEDLILAARHENAGLCVDDIRQQITAQVLPASWAENGGKATIRPWEANCSLVVMHDEPGHEQVASYLESLRVKAPQK